jgi:uncharacterized protein YraI
MEFLAEHLAMAKGENMNRKQLFCAVVSCACLLAFVVFAAQVMNVQVRDGHVRSTPSFLGKILGSLSYGQRVAVTGASGDWSEVSFAGSKGWIHSSALTNANLALRSGSGQAPTGVSGQEMALAGKGFNAQVERQYRQSHGGDFASVDLMERNAMQTERLMAFLKEGGVTPRGGMQ